jgi:hypothetical protein
LNAGRRELPESDCPKTSLIAVTEAKPAPVAAWARSIGRFARKTHAQVGTLIIVEMPTLAPRATRRSIGPIHPRRTKPAPPHRQAWPRPQTPRVKPSQREWLHSRSERSWALPELSFSRARSASPGASCGASRRPAANRSATAAQPPTHGHPEPGISATIALLIRQPAAPAAGSRENPNALEFTLRVTSPTANRSLVDGRTRSQRRQWLVAYPGAWSAGAAARKVGCRHALPPCACGSLIVRRSAFATRMASICPATKPG